MGTPYLSLLMKLLSETRRLLKKYKLSMSIAIDVTILLISMQIILPFYVYRNNISFIQNMYPDYYYYIGVIIFLFGSWSYINDLKQYSLIVNRNR